MPRLLLTVPEAAEALAISRSKLYELLAAGLVRSGPHRRVPPRPRRSTRNLHSRTARKRGGTSRCRSFVTA